MLILQRARQKLLLVEFRAQLFYLLYHSLEFVLGLFLLQLPDELGHILILLTDLLLEAQYLLPGVLLRSHE